jgi:hypothetical protein
MLKPLVAHILLPLIILKMAIEIYIKTQEQLQQKTQLGLISKNYTLHTERKNLGTRIYCLMGFGLVNGFTDHLRTRLGTTSNYSTTALSTIHKLPQHLLSLFQPDVFSPAIPWQWLLTMEFLQLHALRSSLHSLPCRTQLNSLSSKPPVITSQHRPHRKHSSSFILCMLQALPSNSCFLQSHCLATGLYTTIWFGD